MNWKYSTRIFSLMELFLGLSLKNNYKKTTNTPYYPLNFIPKTGMGLPKTVFFLNFIMTTQDFDWQCHNFYSLTQLRSNIYYQQWTIWPYWRRTWPPNRNDLRQRCSRPKVGSKVVEFKATPFKKTFWMVLRSDFGSGEHWRRSFPVGGHVRPQYGPNRPLRKQNKNRV